MRTRYLIAIVAAMASCVACQKNNFDTEYAGGESIVRFVPSMAEVSYADGLTKSAAASADQSGLSLSATDGSFTLPMTCETSVGINLGGVSSQTSDVVATKGTLHNETGSDVSLGKYVDKFMVAAWNIPSSGDPVKVIPDGSDNLGEYVTTNGYQTVMKKNGADGKKYWMTVQNQTQTVSGAPTVADDEYIWKAGEVKTFYAYANLPESGATMALLSKGAGQTMTYTVPEAASDQTDIMMGFYNGTGNGTGTAGIEFEHPLTAVKFLYGEIDDNPVIKSITLKGVATSGTAKMNSTGNISWEVAGFDFTVKQENASGLSIDTGSKLIGEPFILIPQDLESENVTVTVVLGFEGKEDVKMEAKINTDEWQAGKTNTYTLGYKSEDPSLLPGIFSVSPTKKVKFAKGNLFCKRTGSIGSYTYEFAMESHQYDYRTRNKENTKSGTSSGPCVINGVYYAETPEGTSGHFFWDIHDNTGYGAFETDLSPGTISDADRLDWGTAFGSGSKWTTLSQEEMKYLVDAANHQRKYVTLYLDETKTNSIKGLVIAPDGFSGTIPDSYDNVSQWEQDEKQYGFLFLPWAGSYSGGSVSSGSIHYWTKTGSTNPYAYEMKDYNGTPTITANSSRSFGYPVRLVQNEPTFIDLGLPSGTLWADVNVGATKPEESGDYFSWGDVTGRTPATVGENAFVAKPFVWANTPFNNGSTDYDSSYFTAHKSEWLVGDGTLKPEYDAAHVNWGGSWRIPTKADFDELLNFTSKEWTSDYNGTGVSGYIFTSTEPGFTDKSIFLPAAGRGFEGGLIEVGDGFYWSSSLNTIQYNSERAYYLLINSSLASSTGNNGRYYGYLVRPVMDKLP